MNRDLAHIRLRRTHTVETGLRAVRPVMRLAMPVSDHEISKTPKATVWTSLFPPASVPGAQSGGLQGRQAVERVRVPLRHEDEGRGRFGRVRPALLPALDRADGDADHVREDRSGDVQTVADAADDLSRELRQGPWLDPDGLLGALAGAVLADVAESVEDVDVDCLHGPAPRVARGRRSDRPSRL